MRTAILFMMVLFSCLSTSATISLLAGANGHSVCQAQFGCSSASIDTTGATLLIVLMGQQNSGAMGVSDTAGNTWNCLTQYGSNTFTGFVQACYAHTVITSASEVITCTTQPYGSCFFLAFSGTDTTSAAFQSGSDVGNISGSNVSSISPGTITLSQTGEVVVTMVHILSVVSGLAIDSSMTILDTVNDGGTHYDGDAYRVVSTSGSFGPTWSWTSGQTVSTPMAAFIPGAASANSQIGGFFVGP